MAKIYPGLNKLLVQELPLPQTSSLLMPSTNAFKYGEIKYVGAIKDKDKIGDEMFKAGDKVYFLVSAGIAMDIPNEDELRLINVTDVLVGIGE